MRLQVLRINVEIKALSSLNIHSPGLTYKQMQQPAQQLSQDNQLVDLAVQELITVELVHLEQQIPDNGHLLNCYSGLHPQTSSKIKNKISHQCASSMQSVSLVMFIESYCVFYSKLYIISFHINYCEASILHFPILHFS
jgi:predicted transcriptional regulator